MILNTVRLQLNSNPTLKAWNFQGVGNQGSHYSLHSAVLLADKEEDLAYFQKACEFLFNNAAENSDFEYVEALLKDTDGSIWHVRKDSLSTKVLKNNEPESLEELQRMLMNMVCYPSNNFCSKRIVGAWNISKSMLASENSRFSRDENESLAKTLRDKEKNLLIQTQSLLGNTFVANKTNLLDLYEHLESYLKRQDELALQEKSIKEKLSQADRYGVRKLEDLKNECSLLERMVDLYQEHQESQENKSILRSMEKLLFLWQRKNSKVSFPKSDIALIASVKKVIIDNQHKIGELERILLILVNAKDLQKERERLLEKMKQTKSDLKTYFMQQKVDLSFVDATKWPKFFQVVDSLLVVDGLAESVLDKEFKTQELFIHHQVERPMAIYQLSSPDHVVDTDQLMKKLKSANQSIFRIFLTDDELQYDSLLKAGMGWAQPI